MVFPIQLCLPDVLPEVDAVAGAKIDPVFENAATNCLGVRQVTRRNALKRRCHLRGGLNIECAQPFCEGASSGGVDVFPDLEHN